MKILVTGGCGFVGSQICINLSKIIQDVHITSLDNLSRKGSWLNTKVLNEIGVKVVHGDTRSLDDIFACGKHDWIIDAAANPSVLAGLDGSSSSSQLVQTNLVGSINLLEVCRAWSAGFILLSTSRVYSISSLADIPLKEGADLFVFDKSQPHASTVSSTGIRETFSTSPPLSLYGSTKLCSELLSAEYSSAFSIPVWINRCGVLAGAGQFGKADQGIFSFWLHSWLADKPLKYIGFNGNGYQVRDCLHPYDLAFLIYHQISSNSGCLNPINVSGGITSSFSLNQLSAWCTDRWGPRSVDRADLDRPYDLPWVVLDNSLAYQSLGWRPTIDTSSILDEIASFAESNPDWLNLSA